MTRRSKELVGAFKNGGREWQPRTTPEKTLVHDVPTDAIGKAIPYGVYDRTGNEAWASVGRDHDTPAFAATSIRQWWKMMGKGNSAPFEPRGSYPKEFRNQPEVIKPYENAYTTN